MVAEALRYAAGDAARLVYLDGATAIARQALPSTGSWDRWASATVTLTLPAGDSTLSVIYASGTARSVHDLHAVFSANAVDPCVGTILTRAMRAPADCLSGGGRMGEMMRAHDWSSTPLGPVESWPQSLCTSVSICLKSLFPILVWWGPELVMLYNDAYRPMLGQTKHPAGARAARPASAGREIWHVIGPMLDRVLARAARRPGPTTSS